MLKSKKLIDVKDINKLAENRSFTLLISIFLSLSICMINKLNFSQTIICLFLLFVIYYLISRNITIAIFLSLFLITYINKNNHSDRDK